MKYKLIFSFLILFILVPSSCLARDYYVSNSGSDSNNGNIDSPFMSIQKAADLVSPGDNVYVRSGTYNEELKINRSGSSNSYISFSAYNGEEVVIDGKNSIPSRYAGLIHINQGVSYIKIEGFRVINSAWGGIVFGGADHIIIKNNETYNTKSSGIQAYGGSNIIVDGNKVRKAVNGGDSECITLSSVDTFEIKNNEVFDGLGIDYGGEGICVKAQHSDGPSRNGLIHHNYVHDLPTEVYIYVGGYDGDVDNVKIYNNRVTNLTHIGSGSGIVLTAEEGGSITNTLVYNNIVDKTDNGILIADWGGIVGTKRNISIVNNTIVSNGVLSEWGGGIGIWTTRNISDVLIANNIVSQNGMWQIAVQNYGSIDVKVRNNLIDGFSSSNASWTDEVLGENYIQEDPQFLNSNYKLSESSPAIDIGLDYKSIGIENDFNGVLRPQGSAFDIGAFEYTCRGDIYSDGEINSMDYLQSILNGDQEIRNAVVDQWGEGCE